MLFKIRVELLSHAYYIDQNGEKYSYFAVVNVSKVFPGTVRKFRQVKCSQKSMKKKGNDIPKLLFPKFICYHVAIGLLYTLMTSETKGSYTGGP